MTTTTFIDSSQDTLKVEDYNSVNGAGFVTVTQDSRKAGFDLRLEDRVPVAEAILGTQGHVLTGNLPDAKVTPGTREGRRVVVGSVSSPISDNDAHYLEQRARRYLAASKAVRRVLAEDSKRQEEERAALKALKERKNALAAEFTGVPWAEYGSVPASTQKAIDAVITLEDR